MLLMPRILPSAHGCGSELSYDSSTYIEPDAQIRPMHDYIVVEPLSVMHSLVLDVIEHTKPLRGLVKAVGPGHYPLCYDHPDKQKRTKMWRSKTFQPTQVKVGDIVELGAVKVDGRMLGYSFQHILWGGKTHIICREADVSGVVDEQERVQGG
jgi:co-chaperonin GroES (HSP10)